MKWAIFRPKGSKISVEKGFPVSISLQTKAIRSYFRVRRTGKYPPSSGKSSRSWSKLRWVEGGLGYSFTLKVKWSYISPTSSKVGVQKVMLCAFQCKPRPSGVSLESRGLKKIPLFPGSRAEVGQNFDALKAVSCTLSVLK